MISQLSPSIFFNLSKSAFHLYANLDFLFKLFLLDFTYNLILFGLSVPLYLM